MTIRALRAFATLHVEKRRPPSERLIVWMIAICCGAIWVALIAIYLGVSR